MDSSTIPYLCRACLSENGEYKSIFVSDDNSGYTIHLSEMIMSCASVLITFGDGLPEQVCLTCAEQTVKMYFFKLKCEESDRILRQRLEQSPLQDIICNIREEKYSEYIEKHGCHRTDLNLTIKSEISIDEPHEVDPIDEKTQAILGLNETENNNSSSEKSVLDGNELCKKKFICELCNKALCSQLGLNRHIHKSHSAIKEFECQTYDKRFSRKEVLIRHKVAHSKKMEFGDFSDNDDIEGDAIIKNTETELYPCPECSVQFTKEEELEMHMKQHEVSSNISCHVCMKKFKKRFVLNRHLRIHSKPHICSTCNKGFFKHEQLTKHMKVHSGAKRHICDICLKGFNNSTHLKNHIRIHSDERPFLCSMCRKGFHDPSSLHRHMKRHSGIKPFLCSTCGYSCATKEHLSVHLRKHTGERPYVCPICNQSFATSSNLVAHRRIHSGERPHECDVCEMKFTESSTLKRHKRTHTGEKPYVCKICAKAFSQSNGLTAHLKKHTGERP